ncbi:MAG: diacylglycerol kinase family protein [bacterium]|nr:diacylglycerol kinase family protein [bacterium]MDY4100726.1 diacylglycerol kinase family protein [Lachnospiraceae bacterium]
MKHIFIVNPYAGNMTFANNLRQQLEQIKGFEYFLFNSRYTGNETELTRKIVHFFPEEQLRIYACGGSGTFRNVLEGVGENPKVELAFYPCGMTNDFLKVFATRDRERFFDIKELINGETITVDSILTNHGRAINTFSCGMDAEIMRYIATQHPVRTVGIQVPYSAYVFQALLRLKRMDLKIRVDGREMDGCYDELCCGNGCVLGGSLCMPQGFVPNDGLESYVFVPSKGHLAFIRILINLIRQKSAFIEKHARVGHGKKVTLSRRDHGPIVANLDGEMIAAPGEWTVEIRPDSVQFVVPRGVKLP